MSLDCYLGFTELYERFKSGKYKAPPVRRVYIPKGLSKTEVRPLGIPTIEDKILQENIRQVLNSIYEEDFKPFSYRFRQGKSAHQAIEYMFKEVSFGNQHYIIDADIKNYFGSINHSYLRDFLDRRVKGGVIRKMIDKWLKAGIIDEGQLTYLKTGTPQGGLISPLFSNVYLHYVLDEWFGLELHPDKTRIVDLNSKRGNGGRSFDFLGFTHFLSESRKGKLVLKRKTSSSKLNISLSKMHAWIKANRHMKLKDLIKALNAKLRGYYNYYGITFNSRRLKGYYLQVRRYLHKWLNRKGGKPCWNWNKFHRLITEWIPLLQPKIYHSFIPKVNPI